MNSLIESLNGLGDQFLRLAWPMLWQSTLLIALVFAVEFALRRKIRPAVRYALWLAVLLKLLLPPSLAVPTSLAWWLRPGATAPAEKRAPGVVVISQVFTPAPNLALAQAPLLLPEPAPESTPMSSAAWALTAWGGIALALLGWLTVRWRRMVGNVHRAAMTPSPASGVTLQELFDEAKRAAGVRRVVRLRLVEQPISPAVYGLFHPVILLPQSLVERIAPEQLRAVLMHELIHFRRADVWINCAQSLLQIFYWWHPLVWLANARIRRVREEAVDDAVMLALRGDAEHYAPALLEVAKLALSRPLATLGLVGILESRSALQHRVERLMNFTTPRRAGLSIVSVLGLAAFTALALPMGEAPPKPAATIAQATSPARQEAPYQSQVPGETNTEDQFELTSDHTTYYSPGEVTQAHGNVVIKYHGMTFNAESAFVSQATGLLIARGAVFHRDKMFITFDTLSFNFKTGDLQTGNLINDASEAMPRLPIRIAADGTYWMGTNSLDLTQLRVVLLAAKETLQDDRGKFNIHIQAAETARFEAVARLVDLCKELGFATVSIRSAQEQPFGPGNSLAASSFDEAYQRYFQRGIQEIQRARDAAQRLSSVSASNGAPAVAPSTVRSAGPQNNTRAPVSAVTSTAPTNLNYASSSEPVPNPFYRDPRRNTGTGRQAIIRKLDQIRLDRFSCDNEPLADVLHRLTIETRELDPDKQGIVFSLAQNPNGTVAASRTIDPNTGLPVAARASSAVNDLESVPIRLKEPLTNLRLADVLDAIATSADKPIKYSFVDYGVVFSPKPPGPELHMRSFRVDPNTFFLALQNFGAVPTDVVNNSSGAVPTVPRVSMSGPGRAGTVTTGGNGLNFVTTTNSMDGELNPLLNFFLAMGVDLRPSTGKNIFYKDRQGLLMVNATSQDLDIIEAAVQTLNTSPPQINLKVKFVEVGSADGHELGLESMLDFTRSQSFRTNNPPDGTNAPVALLGILTAPQFRNVLKVLEQSDGADLINESQATTLSGRQAQIQVVDERILATYTKALADGTKGLAIPTNSVVEKLVIPSPAIPTGPTLDVIPVLGADGDSIQMRLIPTLVDFQDVTEVGPFVLTGPNIKSNGVAVATFVEPAIFPRFRVRQVSLDVTVWDGQTVVLGSFEPNPPRIQHKVPVLGDLPGVGRLFRSETSAPKKKNILIFVTPTLIEPSGNRVHPDEK